VRTFHARGRLGGIPLALESAEMAKKRVKKVEAVQDEKALKPVRLDLSLADHERLDRLASERGLSKSAYARQAVLNQMRADERQALL
jgi:hypothetical protein